MEVPANNNQLPTATNGDGTPSNKPDNAYLLMAAATMYKQGRLTVDQQPTFDSMSNTERASRGLPPTQMQPNLEAEGVLGYTQPKAGAKGREYSDVEIPLGEGFEQTGGITGGIRVGDISQQRRSENVEDKRARGQIDLAESQADLSLARQKGQPFSGVTEEQKKQYFNQPLATSNMAKQLGINDVDAFETFVKMQRQKEAGQLESGKDKLKAAMKGQRFSEADEFVDTAKAINKLAPKGINPESMRRSENVEDVSQETGRSTKAMIKQAVQEAIHGKQEEPLLNRPEDIARAGSTSKLSKQAGIGDTDLAMKLDRRLRVEAMPKEKRDKILRDLGLKAAD